MNAVLVRMECPGRPVTVMDPSPHVPDENGHVWRVNLDEPFGSVYCLLCCDDYGDPSTTKRCAEAHLLEAINEERARWIAAHRIEGVSV